jgi:hypothetical protein
VPYVNLISVYHACFLYLTRDGFNRGQWSIVVRLIQRVHPDQKKRFRWLAEGIFTSDRYFAIVRRAMRIFCVRKRAAIS